MATQKIPASAVDTFLHFRNDEDSEGGNERIILPITRYANILNAPKVVKDPYDSPGAPFVFLQTGSENLNHEEIMVLSPNMII